MTVRDVALVAASSSPLLSTRVTAPPLLASELKSLLAESRVMSLAPALRLVAPVTVMVSLSVIAPPAVTVRELAEVAASSRVLLSTRVTAAPVAPTELKSLLAVSRLMLLLPPLRTVAPVTVMVPLSVRVPPVVTVRDVALVAASSRALLSTRVTAPPLLLTELKSLLAESRVMSLPPALRLVAPVTVMAPLSVMAPPAVTASELAVVVARSRAVLSARVIAVALPVTVLSSLPLLSRTMVPAALRIRFVSVRAALWLIFPAVVRARLLVPAGSRAALMLMVPAVAEPICRLAAVMVSSSLSASSMVELRGSVVAPRSKP